MIVNLRCQITSGNYASGLRSDVVSLFSRSLFEMCFEGVENYSISQIRTKQSNVNVNGVPIDKNASN